MSKQPAATHALMAFAVESAGLVIVVVVAGMSEKLGTLMLVFIIGLWLLFLIEHTSEVTSFANRLTTIEGSAKNG